MQQALRDAHREVLAVEQEAVDGVLVARDVALEHRRAGARGGEGALDGRLQLLRAADLGHAALARAVDGLDDGRHAHLVERFARLVQVRKLAAARGVDPRLFEGGAHLPLVRDDLGGAHGQARKVEALGEPRGREDRLVGAHRRDGDRLDPELSELGEDAVDVGEAADDPVIRLGEERRRLGPVDHADGVPERARLPQQPELRPRAACENERLRH